MHGSYIRKGRNPSRHIQGQGWEGCQGHLCCYTRWAASDVGIRNARAKPCSNANRNIWPQKCPLPLVAVCFGSWLAAHSPTTSTCTASDKGKGSKHTPLRGDACCFLNTTSLPTTSVHLTRLPRLGARPSELQLLFVEHTLPILKGTQTTRRAFWSNATGPRAEHRSNTELVYIRACQRA